MESGSSERQGDYLTELEQRETERDWREPYIATKERILRYVIAETEIIRVGRPSPFVTAEQIATAIGYSVPTTRKILRELVAENKVKVQGSIGQPHRFFIEAKKRDAV